VAGGWSGVGVFATGVSDTTQTSVSTGTVQPNPTQTLTSYTTVEKVTTTVSTQYQTLTVTQTSQTIVPVEQSAVIPDWLYYSFGFMAFLIVVLLAAILIIVIKRR
jgi:carboxypeptidase C (cathepsin A)